MSHRSQAAADRGIRPFATLLLFATAVCPPHLAAQIRDVGGVDALVRSAIPGEGPGGVVLIARDGEVLFRRAYGMADLELGVPMEPTHVFLTGSITKQFTAAAILRLVQGGRIGLEDRVGVHVDGLSADVREVTIEQVLTHTSGLPNLVDVEGFWTLARQDHTVEDLLALTSDVPLLFPPGTSFRYSDTGYILLGAVIERVSGMSYADYLEKELFEPLGMTSSRYADDRRIIPRRVQGYSFDGDSVVNAAYISMTVPHAAGAVASSGDDLIRWYALLDEGRVLEDGFRDQAWSGRPLPDGRYSGYGMGWKVCSIAGRSTVEHGGFVNGFNANVIHVPGERVTVVVLLNQDGDRPDAGALARRIARWVFTGSSDLPEVRLSPSQASRLVGHYSLEPDDVLEIRVAGNRLVLSRNGRSPVPLTMLTPTRLSLAESEGALVYDFEVGTAGPARRVRASLRCEPLYVAVRGAG